MKNDSFADDSDEDEREESSDDEDLPDGWNISEIDGVWTLIQRLVIRENPKHPVRLSNNPTDKSPFIKVDSDHVTCSTAKFGYTMVRATHGMEEGAYYFEARVLKGQPQFHSSSNTTASLGSYLASKRSNSVKKKPPVDYEPHVRIGWSLEKGDVKGPVGFDKFSFAYRDVKGDAFTCSKGKPYADSYGVGDVIGCYIYIPHRTKPKPPPRQVREEVKETNYNGIIITEVEEEEFCEDAQIRFFKNGVDQGVAFANLLRGRYFPAVSLYMGAAVTCNFGPNFDYPPKLSDEIRTPIPISMLEKMESTTPSRKQKTPNKSSDAQASLRAAVQKATTPIRRKDDKLPDFPSPSTPQIPSPLPVLNTKPVEERSLEPPKKRRKKEESPVEKKAVSTFSPPPIPPIVPSTPPAPVISEEALRNAKNAAARGKIRKTTKLTTTVTQSAPTAPPPKKKRKESTVNAPPAKRPNPRQITDDKMDESEEGYSQLAQQLGSINNQQQPPHMEKHPFDVQPQQRYDQIKSPIVQEQPRSKVFEPQPQPQQQQPQAQVHQPHPPQHHDERQALYQRQQQQAQQVHQPSQNMHTPVQLPPQQMKPQPQQHPVMQQPTQHAQLQQPHQPAQHRGAISMMNLLNGPSTPTGMPQFDMQREQPKQVVSPFELQFQQQQQARLEAQKREERLREEVLKREKQQQLLQQQLAIQKQHDLAQQHQREQQQREQMMQREQASLSRQAMRGYEMALSPTMQGPSLPHSQQVATIAQPRPTQQTHMPHQVQHHVQQHQPMPVQHQPHPQQHQPQFQSVIPQQPQPHVHPQHPQMQTPHQQPYMDPKRQQPVQQPQQQPMYAREQPVQQPTQMYDNREQQFGFNRERTNSQTLPLLPPLSSLTDTQPPESPLSAIFGRTPTGDNPFTPGQRPDANNFFQQPPQQTQPPQQNHSSGLQKIRNLLQ